MSPQGSREKTMEPVLDKFSFAANAAICNLFLYTIFYREAMTRIDEADLLKTHIFTFKLNALGKGQNAYLARPSARLP
jgi:hypothetical protein